jgi:hypothetical protein
MKIGLIPMAKTDFAEQYVIKFLFFEFLEIFKNGF